tara:strand:- start:164 stop:337 length:174 start_codon:yes stop_codon:yes gene_type:complete
MDGLMGAINKAAEEFEKSRKDGKEEVTPTSVDTAGGTIEFETVFEDDTTMFQTIRNK